MVAPLVAPIAPDIFDDDDDGWEGADRDSPAAVGDHAWSVLDWILTLFEKDEAAVERTGQGRFGSP